MNRGIFGWDLPPGCSINDIPGNSDEDAKWEQLMMDFYEKTEFTKKELEFIDPLNETVDYIVQKAITYGMELGRKEQQMTDAENRFYEERFTENDL
jgi:hypothetical protein